MKEKNGTHTHPTYKMTQCILKSITYLENLQLIDNSVTALKMNTKRIIIQQMTINKDFKDVDMFMKFMWIALHNII